MSHNDYQVINRCSHCGKPVFAPRSWIGRKKGSNDRSPKPTYRTCRCPAEK